MRDRRFITKHRGGLLSKEQHFHLMNWACICAEHVLSFAGDNIDFRLISALETARKWVSADSSVGEARTASLNAIAVARESTDQFYVLLARCAGHAAATAHMADHALRAADYALKVIKLSGNSTEAERTWQDDHLPDDVRELVLSVRDKK